MRQKTEDDETLNTNKPTNNTTLFSPLGRCPKGRGVFSPLGGDAWRAEGVGRCPKGRGIFLPIGEMSEGQRGLNHFKIQYSIFLQVSNLSGSCLTDLLRPKRLSINIPTSIPRS